MTSINPLIYRLLIDLSIFTFYYLCVQSDQRLLVQLNKYRPPLNKHTTSIRFKKKLSLKGVSAFFAYEGLAEKLV